MDPMGLTYPSSLQTFFLAAEGGFVHVTWPPPRSKTCQADEIAYCRCRLRSGGGGPVVGIGRGCRLFTKDFVGT